MPGEELVVIFAVTWSGGLVEFHGPFANEDDATEFADQSGAENVGILGPVTFHSVRKRADHS